MAVPYPELLSVPLDSAQADRWARFLAPLEAQISWRELSLIPRDERHVSPVRGALSLLSAAAFGHHPYLAPLPGQAWARRAHAALRGPRAARLFDFLCLNRAIDARELSFAHDRETLDRAVAEQVVLRRGESLLLPVTVVPWGDRYYLGESLYLREHASAYGLRGAPLDTETDVQIRWLRQNFRGRKFRRFLELGTGTGIVLFELRALADQREGGEYEERSLCFARMNGHLRDPAAKLFWTDMFSGATGRYDLLHFAPWQPSESSLHLLTQFVEGLPEFLTDDGDAVMFVSHYADADDDVVLTPLATAMAARGLTATQDVVAAFSDAHGNVVGQSFLHLRRGRGAKVIRVKPSPTQALFMARRKLRRAG